MKQEPFKFEFSKMMKWLGTNSIPSQLKFDADYYKKIFSFFLLGDSYYFIINHHTLKMEYVSKEIEAVMGYLPSEFEIGFMNDQIHPEDRSWFLVIGSSMIDFFSQLPIEKLMKYKVRYDIRFRKKTVTMRGYFTRAYY